MKQCVPSKDMKALSKKGALVWEAYCLEKEWGVAFDAEQQYLPVLQPSIGQLLEYAQDRDIEYYLTNTDKEPIVYLWSLVKRDLED